MSEQPRNEPAQPGTADEASPNDERPVGAAGSAYRVRVGGFDGPLDLLLHLVRVNELDITDIPIVEITEQYNEYLAVMREMNLEIAGEYLLMASTLMHIKSRMLLPPDPEAEDEAEDPRAELTQQLLDYQRFKQAAENLQAMDSVRSLIWTRDGRVPEEFRGEEVLVVDVVDLMKAFRTILVRLGDEQRLRLKRDDVSVADKINWLSEQLEQRDSLKLLELIAELPSRLERIAVFLAILEMVRLRMIVAFQRRTLGEIRIALREPDEPDGIDDAGTAAPDGDAPADAPEQDS